MAANPAAPRKSALLSLDWQNQWLGSGRSALPAIPHHLDVRTLDLLGSEGLDRVIRRHRQARDSTRAGLRGLGMELYVKDGERASVATVARVPPGLSPGDLLSAAARYACPKPRDRGTIVADLGMIAGPAFGELEASAIRLSRAGARRGRLS
jgi:aspartate aminotransferase-like enzyme